MKWLESWYHERGEECECTLNYSFHLSHPEYTNLHSVIFPASIWNLSNKVNAKILKGYNLLGHLEQCLKNYETGEIMFIQACLSLMQLETGKLSNIRDKTQLPQY